MQSSVEILTFTFCFAATGVASRMQTASIAKMMTIFLFMVITCYKYYLKIKIFAEILVKPFGFKIVVDIIVVAVFVMVIVGAGVCP